MARTIHERIKAALAPDARLADIERTLSDTEAERDRLSSAAVAAAAESTDWALAEDDREAVAQLGERHRRTAQALANAIEQLVAAAEAKRNSERRQADEAEREAIIARRDAAAELFRSEGPDIQRRFVDLLTAVKDSNAEIAAARLPLETAEQLARACGPFTGVGGAPRSWLDIKLPSFANPHEFAWPASDSAARLHRARIEEQTRQQRVAYERNKAAEGARWWRFLVVPPENRQAVRISTRRGEGLVSRPGEHLMTAEQVAAAKALGCRVEPLKANQSVGGSPGVAAFVA